MQWPLITTFRANTAAKLLSSFPWTIHGLSNCSAWCPVFLLLQAEQAFQNLSPILLHTLQQVCISLRLEAQGLTLSWQAPVIWLLPWLHRQRLPSHSDLVVPQTSHAHSWLSACSFSDFHATYSHFLWSQLSYWAFSHHPSLFYF